MVDNAGADTNLTARRAEPGREHAMGGTMPFAKYTVDPERIEAMRAAFHRVCDVLQLDCGTQDRMTERIVMKIVELAKTGELDPERLCIDTLAEVEPPPASASKAGAANEGGAARAS